MPSQQPAANRSGLPYSMTLRLSSPQYRGLAILSEPGNELGPMASIVRDAIERHLETYRNPATGATLLAELHADPTLGLDEANDREYEQAQQP